MPHVRVIGLAVQTRDGFIAREPGHSTIDWRSNADATFFTDFLNGLGEEDVIVVGNNTYKTVRRLSRRNCIVLTRSVTSTAQRNPKLLYCNPEGASLTAALGRYRTAVLLGGTETYTLFLKQNLIDEIYLTVEPVKFGSGLRLFDSPEDIGQLFYLEWTERLSEEGTFLRHYLRKVPYVRA